MDKQAKKALITSLPLFKDFTSSEVKLLSDKVTEQSFKSDQTIIEQGETGDRAYIISSGGVKVYRISEEGGEIYIATLGPNEVVGEMSLIDEEPRSAYVQTIQPTTALVLTRRDFLSILSSHPKSAINLLKTLSLRVRALSEHLEDILSKNLMERSLKTLQTLSSYFPNKEIALSHEELAAIVGGTRARVTEVLDQLQKEGRILLAHRKIRLL